MEIKDNTFLRQFEAYYEENLVTVEYSFQERKIFLTKIGKPDPVPDEFVSDFITEILAIASERKLKVVPTYPRIAAFFRKNPKYKELLPPGIKI